MDIRCNQLRPRTVAGDVPGSDLAESSPRFASACDRPPRTFLLELLVSIDKILSNLRREQQLHTGSLQHLNHGPKTQARRRSGRQAEPSAQEAATGKQERGKG